MKQTLIYSLIFVISFIHINFQTSLIAQDRLTPLELSIQATRSSHKAVLINKLFTVAKQQSLYQQHTKGLKSAQYLNIESVALAAIISSKPAYMITSIQDQHGRTFELELERHEVYESGAKLCSSDNEQGQAMTSGVFYRGIISGVAGSLVALSFYDHELAGILSTPADGNIVIGRTKNIFGVAESSLPHILYYERDLLISSNAQCGVTDITAQDLKNLHIDPSESTIYPDKCKKVRIYFECDYRLFQDKGSKPAVEAYINSVFNVIKTLYFNEKITVEISEIFVWTTQDNYLHTDLVSIIFDYAAKRKQNFNGDLAQLVSTFPPGQQGGIAFLDGMCRIYGDGSGRSPHSFAFIYNTFSSFPQYSWTVEVMAHELGHNFGCPHTHNCVWGPNKNTSIDNCIGPDDGIPCNQGPRPTNGGTIMSYCHLVPNIGINFTKGFGQEPGDLLRAAVKAKSCLSSTIVPIQKANIAGPYYEGDTIKLRATPNKATYTYDWFHYEVKIPNATDTIIKVGQTGEYKVAISEDCTEYGKPIDIIINPINVNLGCKVIEGKKDSVKFSKTMNADDALYTDSIVVPASAYQSIPAGTKDIIVELQCTITPISADTWNKSVIMSFRGPNSIVENLQFDPNANEADGFRQVKTYIRKLGIFDPKGTWKFTVRDNKPDLGVDARITWTLVLRWKQADIIPTCELPLCGGSSRILDAGIPGASYSWSTGASTRTITATTEGNYSVTVTKNGKTSSHSIILKIKNTQFTQNQSICQGDTLRIGNSKYTKAGVYTNVLKAADGCDSVLITSLTVNSNPSATITNTYCYGELVGGVRLTKDTVFANHTQSYLGCDSTTIYSLKVHPEIKIEGAININCENIGASIKPIITGGLAPYVPVWSHGTSTLDQQGLKDGVYMLSVKDNNSCKVTKDFIVDNFDSVAVVETITNVRCFAEKNGSIEAKINSGAMPFNISWSTGEKIANISGLNRGKYNLYVSDNNGCTFSREYFVNEPDLLIALVDSKASSGNDGSAWTTVFGGVQPYTYKWSNGATTDRIDNLSPGIYSVTITDKNGCISVSTITVSMSTGIDLHQSIDIKINPNPVSDILYINSKEHVIKQYVLYDTQSRVISQNKYSNLKKEISINMKAEISGNYILEIKTKNGDIIRKLISKI